jgi:hypothetical protein
MLFREMGLLYYAGVDGIPEDPGRGLLHLYFAALGGDLEAHIALGCE